MNSQFYDFDCVFTSIFKFIMPHKEKSRQILFRLDLGLNSIVVKLLYSWEKPRWGGFLLEFFGNNSKLQLHHFINLKNSKTFNQTGISF